MSLLEVSHVDVHYDRAQALTDVSLSVDTGEIVGVIGPNGAGKTTLLDVLSGVKEYDGTVTFDGTDLTTLSPRGIVQRGLIQCPETRDLYSYFSVEKNLLMGAYARGAEQTEENLEMVYELFPRLAERREQNARTMSGGEQQMLAIGRALMGDPELLMLDEPTLGLAPVVIDQISETLVRLSEEGLTVLLAEQNSSFALRHAERLYLLETGSVELSGTADELKDNEYVREAYIGVV